MVSLTKSVMSPPAAMTTAWRLAQVWRNWATRSPRPTILPLASTATWPETKTTRPDLTSIA